MDKQICHTIRLLRHHSLHYKKTNNIIKYNICRQDIDNQEYSLFSIYNQVILGTTLDDYITKINYIGKIVHINKHINKHISDFPLVIDRYGEIFCQKKKKKHQLISIEPPLFHDEQYITDRIYFYGKKQIVRS